MIHRVSIAVFKEIRGALSFVDGWFDGDKDVVAVKLAANSHKSVRGHSER